MKKYLRLFAALERIFGKGYVSRLMGKQSNVITLPDKQARKFLDTELNVMEASEGAVKKGIQDLETVISDTKRLSTLNDQELLTITNNAERLAVKVNPPAPPPAPTADVLSITTKVNKNKDPNVLIDEYNKNQTRLRLTDDEGGTAISYDEFRKLQSRNNEIEKTLESLNVKPALDEVKPEGIVIPFTKKTEDFATGGRVEMAGGGILKLAMKFFNDNNPVSAYKKYLKYVKETAQKDPAKLAPEVGGIVVGSELIHRGLRRKLKEVKEKNNENDSENLETDNRTEKAGGGVSQGLDYLMGIERRGYSEGTTGLNATPQQNAMISDMHKRGMDVDTISTVVGVSTQEVQDAINSQTPAQVNQLNPIGTLSKIGNFFSNPVVQGIGAVATGGLTSLGTFAKGQIGGYLAGKAISPMVQARLAAESFRDSTDGPFGGYNDFDGTEGTFSTDTSDTGASSGGVDSAGDGGDGYATGGRVGFKKGSFLINTAIDAAKNLSKKKSKKELKRQLTDDEIDDLAADVGDLDAYLDFDGTVGSAEKIRKQHKEYMDYMYYQYKTGRLDPKPGEMNTSRMQYLRNKREQAEMTDDPKLFNPNERDELDNLEETFSPMGTSNKINISDPKTAESFTEFAKQNDPEGFKKIEKIVDDINNKNTLENFDITGRKKNAGGGILKTIGKKLIKKPKKYKFTGEESLNDLYELERQGKITREDMNVYSPRYLEYLDAQIINKEKLYTPKEWEKTPEVLKNKMRGRIDPDWEEANFGEEFNWDQARSIEMKQQKQLQDFDITGRKKNAGGGLNYLMGL
jgi:hypothetical protein